MNSLLPDNDAPLVSVVIPIFNRAAFMDEAVNSVMSQTFTNWELILVDDGSTDGSFEKAQGWAERHPDRIRCITHEGRVNRGISATRNRGNQVARGSYLACLDSDDKWVPEKLERQIAIVRRHPEVGMIGGATMYWVPAEPWQNKLQSAGGPQNEVIGPPRLFYEMYPLGTGTSPSINTVLLRRDVAERIGGWEEDFRTSYEDQAMLIKVYLTEKVYLSSEQCDLYRQHPDTIMKTELVRHHYFRQRFKYLVWLESWLQREQPGRKAELALVRSRLREKKLLICRNPVGLFTWRAIRKVGKLLGIVPTEV